MINFKLSIPNNKYLIRFLFYFFICIPMSAMGQCKPLELSTLKEILFKSSKAQNESLLNLGFQFLHQTITPEEGLTLLYGACWVDFKDGYARYAQNITLLPSHRLIAFSTVYKENIEEIKTLIKKTTISKGRNDEGVEEYEDESYYYSFDVSAPDALAKKHPAYGFAIGKK
jgi:hypothetical protein